MMKQVLVPPMLAELVYSTISSMDGKVYSGISECPFCGGRVWTHDIRRKKFATLIEGNTTRDIHVSVRRFYCQDCGRLIYAEDAPFYEGTRVGAPIVDICIANRHLPHHHVARILRAMHIDLDRGTIRNYSQRKIPPVQCVRLYNIEIPLSLISLSELTIFTHKG